MSIDFRKAFGKEKASNCVEVSNEQIIKIYDFENQKCRIVKPNELKDKENLKTLEINNLLSKTICCVSVDNCLIDHKEQKCDCLIMEEDTTLVFVEMKTNATSTSFETISDRLNDAKSQIISTQTLIEGQIVELKSFKKRALVCFRKDILTGSSMKSNSVSVNKFKRDFLKENNFRIDISNKLSFA